MNWQEYERNKAKKHRGKHIGGPRKEDYKRGNVKGEVKHRKTPVTRPELIKARSKGIKEFDSLSGYTGPALEYIKIRKNMKLFCRGKRII
jgi:hypothetical protein